MNIDKVIKAKGVKDIATLFAGNVSAQAITLIFTPILARIYSPESFGAMSTILSITAVLSVVSCLRYELSIVLPKDDKTAQNIFALSMLISITIFFFIKLIIFIEVVSIGFIATYLKIDFLVWLVPIAVLSNGMKNCLEYWNTRKENFRIISNSILIVSFLTTGLRVAFGVMLPENAFWLVMGNIFGILGAAIYMLLKNWDDLVRDYQIKEIIAVLKKYKAFPQFGAANDLINQLSQSLPIIFLASFYSSQIVGYFGLAYAVLRKPTQLIVGSLKSYLLSRMAKINRERIEQRSFWKKSTLALSIIGIIPFSILFLWGPTIFTIVFGEKWLIAGQYGSLLSPWLFSSFINPPSTQLFIVQQKLQFKLNFEIITFILRGIAIYTGYLFFNSAYFSILFFMIISTLANICYIAYAYIQSAENSKIQTLVLGDS